MRLLSLFLLKLEYDPAIKVVLVDKTSGEQLSDPVTVINSTVPLGSLRIRLPAPSRPGPIVSRC